MRSGKPVWPRITLFALLAVVVALVACGGDDDKDASADAQTVRFQKPTDKGEDPFTKPADVRGPDRVDVGSGPYGGTGSDLVCDRELLIRSLRARPDRLREWARVLDVEPTPAAVARYIRRLRPVTLTRDTRVTNHSFVDGRATGYQAILQAGTAVLVDEDGKPVARCRCGNPLLEPVFVETAKCLACPANYNPPPPCEPYGECYRRYPRPPRVRVGYREPATTTPQGDPARAPSASFSPAVGRRGDRFVLSASGFRPDTRLNARLVRPDGVVENYAINTNSRGSGTYTFAGTGEGDVLGTYSATVTDPGSGDRATATARLLEREAASAPQRAPEQQTPPRDPNYDCPDQPPASPGEDYLRNCPPD